MGKYGLSSWIVARLAPEEAIEKLGASTFKEIEMSAAESPLVKAWEKDPTGIRRKMESAGLTVRSVHNSDRGYDLDAEDPALRQASLAAQRDYIDWVRATGAEMLVIHPTRAKDISTPEKRAACKARSMESLKVLAEYAGRAGVKLAVENLPSNKIDRPGAALAELREMIEGLGDHVGLCFDIGHTVMRGSDPLKELRDGRGKLISLHLHDVNSENRDHFIPGEGTIDWPAVLGQLDSDHFPGLRLLEVSPPQDKVEERIRAVAAVKDRWEAR